MSQIADNDFAVGELLEKEDQKLLGEAVKKFTVIEIEGPRYFQIFKSHLPE